uniref:Nitroreductase family protein n=1 Tax=Trichomonas vaginalis TaxID=5722 RepID=A0AAU7YP95_TRIVA
MSVLKCIQARRTIRHYVQGEEVPKADIDLIANSGLTAPSSMDIQGVDIYVDRGQEKLAKIEEATLKALPQYATKYFVNRHEQLHVKNVITCDAPVLFVLVKNERAHKDYYHIDCGLIVESMILLAQDMGYSTMCIGAIGMADLSEVLGIPKDAAIIGLAMGKAAPEQDHHKRPIKSKVVYAD